MSNDDWSPGGAALTTIVDPAGGEPVLLDPVVHGLQADLRPTR